MPPIAWVAVICQGASEVGSRPLVFSLTLLATRVTAIMRSEGARRAIDPGNCEEEVEEGPSWEY